MKQLSLTNSTYLDMIAHGLSDTTQEVCGVLLGKKQLTNSGGKTKWRGNEFIPITNIDEETDYQHYTFDPNEFINAIGNTPHVGGDGKDFVGIFHTHPHNHPIPSQKDINRAGYNVFYVIYSPKYNNITNHFCTETGEPWKEARLTTYGK